jgi:hemerythrin
VPLKIFFFVKFYLCSIGYWIEGISVPRQDKLCACEENTAMPGFEKPREFVIWGDQYSVGIGAIDEQHRKLVTITNELYNGLFSGRFNQAEMEESFRKSVHATVEYAKVHFATEEELMRKLAYPDYVPHKTQHEEFATRILKDVGAYESGNTKIGTKFVYFLRDWFMQHIAVTDKAFALYAKSKSTRSAHPVP